jgi:hypothetical protein
MILDQSRPFLGGEGENILERLYFFEMFYKHQKFIHEIFLQH